MVTLISAAFFCCHIPDFELCITMKTLEPKVHKFHKLEIM